ncbi:MAG: diguanylate cyclase, partial [Pseudomonadota bacterium]
MDADDHTAPVMPDHLRRLSTAAALIDADGGIVDTNLAWGQLFAAPGAVAPGADVHLLVHEDERDLFRTRVGEIVRGAAPSTRLELRCLSDGESFWCRLSLAPFDSSADHLTITAEDISEEHLTTRVLTANEALFRSLAESSPVGLARLAPDLTITYASPSWRRVTGEDEGQPFLNLGSIIHPDDRDDALDTCRARIATGSAEPVVARLKTDGTDTRWASLRLGEVADAEVGLIGYVVTVEEVTEIVTASESQGQLAGVIESTSDLVGIADLRTGSLLYLNAAAQQQFGPLGDEPRHVTELYAEGALDFYRDEVYPVLRRGETWSGDLEMVRRDGSTIRVRQTVAVEIGPDGEPARASVLGRDVSDEQQALDELAYKATHDALTGLPNRSLLVDHLELALARSARDRRPVAVLFVDLDRFKIVNDTYGHDAGDDLLRDLAERMSSVLRPSDTVARLGGDEFVVLCEDIDGENDALTIAERIRSAIEDSPFAFDGDDLTVGASIGIAISNGGSSREPANLLQRADAAMYRAKNAGRGRTELFDDVRRDRAKRRAEQTEQLAKAIEDGDLDVHYQPIVDLHSGRVAGVEALVRWLHPTNGLIGPSEFLPLAVETGMAADLDALVIARAATDATAGAQRWGATRPWVHVTVDVSTLVRGRRATAIDDAVVSTG